MRKMIGDVVVWSMKVGLGCIITGGMLFAIGVIFRVGYEGFNLGWSLMSKVF